MADRNFMELLRARWADDKLVCGGLDSELGKIPEAVKMIEGSSLRGSVLTFNREIVDATHDLVGCYKPNLAFYAALGPHGLVSLQRTIEYINEVAPEVPVILDAKYGDIGNTNDGYVSAAFGFFGADAVTVHPYLGEDSLEPFLAQANKGVIVLCKTSNPGSGEFQDLKVGIDGEELDHLTQVGASPWNSGISGHFTAMFNHVAYRVSKCWNKNGNCAVVVGAPYKHQLDSVRRIVGDLPILLPGLGFQQQGIPIEVQVQQVVEVGQDSNGVGMIPNSSRGIIFASNGPDFAEAARRETQKLHDLINQYRKED